MQSTMPDKYPTWRQVYGAIVKTPFSPAGETSDAAFLRSKQARLAELCLTSVQVDAQFIADLKRFVTKDGRQEDPVDAVMAALERYKDDLLITRKPSIFPQATAGIIVCRRPLPI
jgi:hypothetical protein